LHITKQIEIGGRTLSLETGKLAKQSSGAVLARYGDTMVLAVVVAEDEPKEGQDFFPLQVEFREKSAAVGKIPGGFFKREARPSEKEILSARLVDRAIRPLFPEEFMCETQVICTVYSSDQENDADIIAAVGASAALMISDIPFDGPMSEVRVGKINGEFIINPTHSQLKDSSLDLVVGGTEDSIVMVEGDAKELPEEDILNALKFAHDYIKVICRMQREFASQLNVVKRQLTVTEINQELVSDVKSLAAEKIAQIHRSDVTKEERSNKYKELYESIVSALSEKYPEQEKQIAKVFEDIQYHDMRSMILNEGRRLDGRKTDEIRPIHCEVGVLPRNHGSALFTRGETQSLTSMTLGTKIDQQILDGLLPEPSKRFMLHYNFPPFSTGETGRYGTTGRREIGHGHLAERSLENMLPDEDEFPYTIRVVSDILESNGSSSMATVCAGTLALMDGGVKIKRPVAGIAMGLIKEGDNVAVLSDILGNEDFLGDMDFKVAGTSIGITGLQMDIKIKGVSFEILQNALEQAREGRMYILEKMKEAIAEPRENISPYAPHLYSMTIPIDMIGAVIGPGGKNIRHIIEQSGAEINIEDDGTVIIAAVSADSARKAQSMIAKITEVPEIGKIYSGRVVKTTEFGAFVEILPGREGLLHISQISRERIKKVEDILKRGDEVTVKIIDIDKETGKISLSRKVLLDEKGRMKKTESVPKS
jgi:polyribonucleotide nucleotidyltransferase